MRWTPRSPTTWRSLEMASCWQGPSCSTCFANACALRLQTSRATSCAAHGACLSRWQLCASVVLTLDVL